MNDRTGQYHAALASPSRRQVLDALLESPDPLDAVAVAELLGLHVTTARFHLDQLTAAGLAKRKVGAEKRRGRPRLLYSPAGPVRDEGARGQLIQVLAGALAREDDPESDAARAGRQWAGMFGHEATDDPVTTLVDAFDRLGFDPDGDSEPDRILLRACPFRDAARQHPEVVCAVHRGLMEQLLVGAGSSARLTPFVEPELCVVTISAE